MAEYWVEVILEPVGEEHSPTTLPVAWFAYAESADTFARALIKLPGIRGIGRGREGRPHTRKWGAYIEAP